LLISCYSLTSWKTGITGKNVAGFIIPLTLVCLTRSLYHLAWLLLLCIILLICFRKSSSFRLLLISSVLAVAVVSGWYLKNYLVFKSFTASTWSGMNIARNVFHDNEIKDSTRIESIEPFSKISDYQRFLPPVINPLLKGLNDRDLLQEMKNDSFINEKHIWYISIAYQYMEASKNYVKDHPVDYLKNVVQSAIIFFAPASRYPVNEAQARKMKYYDLLYSFNLSQLAEGKQQRRIALTISALPKALFYLLVFFLAIRGMIKKRQASLVHLFIIYVIGYIFTISSFFEHYENMRFRYEAEPLFLVLATFVLSEWIRRRKMENGK
jgi:hypothetical protein